MEDIFEDEQKILDNALLYSSEIKDGELVCAKKYTELIDEYRRLLKQLRRITKLSDRTAISLNESKHDLLDKVHIDALTGIYNRRFVEENLERIIKVLSRNDDVLSILMMDIDYFKKYNDTYGHGEGDKCLIKVAEAIKNSLSRADDFTARYGGEEFIVILPATDEIGARYVAGKILENIRMCNITHEKNKAADCVTISIGVTSGKVKGNENGSDFIKRADTALYQSKQDGRNRYTYVDFEEE